MIHVSSKKVKMCWIYQSTSDVVFFDGYPVSEETVYLLQDWLQRRWRHEQDDYPDSGK